MRSEIISKLLIFRRIMTAITITNSIKILKSLLMFKVQSLGPVSNGVR